MLKIYENNNWVEYPLLIPYTINDKKDETEDNAVVSFLTTEDKNYSPRTKVKLIDEIETDWIIENPNSKRIGFKKWQIDLELIEPVEILKGYILDNSCVTQPLNPDINHPKKSMMDVINRLLKIAITHKDGETDKDLSSIISIVVDERLNLESPEFPFTECTLFDALLEVGLFLDSMPKLRFNISGGYDLYFEPLDIENKINHAINNLTLEERQHPISNYSNQIVSSVYNTTSYIKNTYPGGNDIGTKIVTEGNLSPFSIDFSNGFIQLPVKIKKINKFELTPDIGEGSVWDNFSDYIYEYKEWQILSPLSIIEDPDIETTPIYARQPYAAYYEMNSNKIHFGDRFLGYYDDIYDLSNPFTWFADLLNFFEKLNNLGFEKMLMKYRITFISVYDAKVKFGNDQIENFSTIANQNGNMIDSYAFSQKMNNVLKRMKHGNYITGKIYKNYNDIPQIGHLINNKYVITNISYTRYNYYYDVLFEMSEDHLRRSEFVREKQEIRSWEIPAGKVSDRYINYKDKISLSFLTNSNNNNSSIRDIRLVFPIFNIFDVEFQDLQKYPGLLAAMVFRSVDNIYPLLSFPMLTAIGNDLLINIYAEDNTIFGHQLVDAGTKHFQRGITYTDEFGEFETVDIVLSDRWTSSINDDVFRAMPNATSELIYPLAYENTEAINLHNLVIKKDAREAFKFTYQLTVEGNEEDETIITKYFTTYTQNKLGWKNREKIKPYVFFYRNKIYEEHDEDKLLIQLELISSQSENPPSINDTFTFVIDKVKIPPTLIIPETYQSFAIGVIDDGVKRPLIIQNKVTSAMRLEIKETGIITLYCDY